MAVIGPPVSFAADQVVPEGWWLAVTSFVLVSGGSPATISAGSAFYSNGTAISGQGFQFASTITLSEPSSPGAPVGPAPIPPSAPGIEQPVFGGGSATTPAPPINITGSPIIPTSAFPPGGGIGSIGDPEGVPIFPPPTPPPIGTVPVGPLVGPAVAPAPVPPSLAGVTQPQFGTGSAAAPPVNGYFPKFTTTTAYAGFPNQPPAGVPIVFANIFTGDGTQITPPSTPTVAQIILDGWGLPGPQNGVGPPTYPTAPGTGLPYVGSVRDGHEEFSERSAGSVLSGDDPAQLHQSEPPPNRRRKRLLAGDPGGSANGA